MPFLSTALEFNRQFHFHSRLSFLLYSQVLNKLFTQLLLQREIKTTPILAISSLTVPHRKLLTHPLYKTITIAIAML